MSRALLIVHRRPEALGPLDALVASVSARLTPDILEPRPPMLRRARGAAVIVMNAASDACIVGTSVRLGVLAGECPRWHVPGAPVPDGSFALLRSDASAVELVTDAAGSRTLWYVLDDDMLIASTSQRAILMLLGSFELNRAAIPWMLSTGTLGPSAGWDRRLATLEAGERWTLDRHRWRAVSTCATVSFTPADRHERAVHVQHIETAVSRACAGMSLDRTKWVLPLSGGVDSRGVLLLMPDTQGLKTVTWGMGGSRDVPTGDAAVAARVAERAGVSNRFFTIDPSREPRERLIERFLVSGEGRVAKISGYLDGFATWKRMQDEGIEGIIRGDEPFGTGVVKNEKDVRRMAALTLMSDYFGSDALERFELAEQRLPDELARREAETLAAWRDRLYHSFRIPRLLAGLTDLKMPYVEVANPLLAYPVLECARRVPDRWRTRKRLWRELVRARMPDVPFAKRPAVLSLQKFLHERQMLELMLEELRATRSADVFSPVLRERLCAAIEAAMWSKEATPSPFLRLRRRTAAGLRHSVWLMSRTRASRAQVVDPMVFVFRAFIVARMAALLRADSVAASDRPQLVASR